MGHIMFNADMSAYKLFLSALYTDTAPGRFQRYKHKNEKISSCVSGPIACDAMRTKFRKFATATLSIPAAVSPFFIFYYSEHDTNATHTFCCCCWWLHPVSGIHMCPRWKAHIRLHSTSDCSLSILLFAHPPPSSGTVTSSSWNCLNTEEGYCHCHWLPLMMTFFAYANPSLWTRVGKRRMTQHTQIFPYAVKRSMSERCHRTNVPSVILAAAVAAQALYRLTNHYDLRYGFRWDFLCVHLNYVPFYEPFRSMDALHDSDYIDTRMAFFLSEDWIFHRFTVSGERVKIKWCVAWAASVDLLMAPTKIVCPHIILFYFGYWYLFTDHKSFSYFNVIRCKQMNGNILIEYIVAMLKIHVASIRWVWSANKRVHWLQH